MIKEIKENKKYWTCRSDTIIPNAPYKVKITFSEDWTGMKYLGMDGICFCGYFIPEDLFQTKKEALEYYFNRMISFFI